MATKMFVDSTPSRVTRCDKAPAARPRVMGLIYESNPYTYTKGTLESAMQEGSLLYAIMPATRGLAR